MAGSHVMESLLDGVLDMESDSMSRDSSEVDSTQHEGLYSRGVSPLDRSFVLNSNSISYILVTAQYFRASPGDTPLDLSRLPA